MSCARVIVCVRACVCSFSLAKAITGGPYSFGPTSGRMVPNSLRFLHVHAHAPTRGASRGSAGFAQRATVCAPTKNLNGIKQRKWYKGELDGGIAHTGQSRAHVHARALALARRAAMCWEPSETSRVLMQSLSQWARRLKSVPRRTQYVRTLHMDVPALCSAHTCNQRQDDLKPLESRLLGKTRHRI